MQPEQVVKCLTILRANALEQPIRLTGVARWDHRTSLQNHGRHRTPTLPALAIWPREVALPAVAVASYIANAIVVAMAITTMQLDTELRDDLAEIARTDYRGVPLAEAPNRTRPKALAYAR